jgi:hypothetical protein
MIPFHDDLGRRGATPTVFGLAALWLAALVGVHLFPGAIWGEAVRLLTVGGASFEAGWEALAAGRSDGVAKALFGVLLPTLLHGLGVGGLVPTLFGVAAVVAFGGRLEAELGWKRFAAFLLVTSVAATLGARFSDGPHGSLLGPGPMLVAMAVAFLVAHPRARIVVLVPVVLVPVPATLPALYVGLVLCVLQIGPVARFLQPFDVEVPGPGAFVAAAAVGGLTGLLLRLPALRGSG